MIEMSVACRVPYRKNLSCLICPVNTAIANVFLMSMPTSDNLDVTSIRVLMILPFEQKLLLFSSTASKAWPYEVGDRQASSLHP